MLVEIVDVDDMVWLPPRSLGSVRREAVISRWDSRTRLLAFCVSVTYVRMCTGSRMYAWTIEYDLLLDVIGFGACVRELSARV